MVSILLYYRNCKDFGKGLVSFQITEHSMYLVKKGTLWHCNNWWWMFMEAKTSSFYTLSLNQALLGSCQRWSGGRAWKARRWFVDLANFINMFYANMFYKYIEMDRSYFPKHQILPKNLCDNGKYYLVIYAIMSNITQ